MLKSIEFLTSGETMDPNGRDISLSFYKPSIYASLFLVYALTETLYATAQKGVFEEVVVVAEKRYESLQDLSQSVTALTAMELDQKNIRSFVDLSSIAPGVTITKNEGFKTVISIRGVGNEANQNAIANPSVSYHLDGVYIASPYALQTDFMDLERIEILRGPQATVFGQNATAGAINVITKEPSTIGFEGKGELTLGEYNLVRFRAGANLPVSDDMAARISLSTNKHDGYSDNIVLGQELDDSDSLSGRMRFLWEVTDDVILNFTAQYFDESVNGSAQKGLLDPTPGSRKLAQDSLSSMELESKLYSLSAEWDLEEFAIVSLTSYQDDEIAIQRDNDRNDINTLPPFAILPSYFDPEENHQKTFTQEFNIVSNELLFDKIDWIAGLFYLDTEVDILIRERLDFNFDGVFDPIDVDEVIAGGGEVGFISDAKPTRESYSGYGRGTYYLTETTRIITGLRYTNDEVESEVTNFFGRFGTDTLSTSGDAVTGRLAVEYDVNGTTMVYAFFTRGYKPGGSNLTYGREDVVAPILVVPTFEDESVNAYETGIKTDLFNSRMRVNAAIFFYDYENLQFQATDPEVFQGGVGNIPESEIYGVEVEFLAFITDDLSIDIKMAAIESEITSSFLALDNVESEAATNALICCGTPLFTPADSGITTPAIELARAAAITDVQGNELPKTPNFTSDISLRYHTELSSWGEFVGILQYTYRGGFSQRVFNNPAADAVPSYDVFNLVLSFDPSDSNWGTDLMVTNITDEDGVNARFTDVFGVGATADELIPPRQIMARLRMEF